MRQLAQRYLRNERPDHTLQATALVNETFLKLLGVQDMEWMSRAHFIGVAARVMRHILVDHARQHIAEKRGGGIFKLPLSRAERVPLPHDLNLVKLDEALQRFTLEYPRQARVVELLFFGGLSTGEVAEILIAGGVETSQRPVERDWKFSRAWLYKEVGNK
ncbi:MAG: RNA polymerase subunit sigma-70 [Acidobacteria bacterium]|nr:RNA polymerase subunit sigma-70 [Acidobacteriota bacterium]